MIIGLGATVTVSASYDYWQNTLPLIDKIVGEAHKTHPQPAQEELQKAQEEVHKYNTKINKLQADGDFEQIHELTSQQNIVTIYNAQKVKHQDEASQKEYKKQYGYKLGMREVYDISAIYGGFILMGTAGVWERVKRRKKRGISNSSESKNAQA